MRPRHGEAAGPVVLRLLKHARAGGYCRRLLSGKPFHGSVPKCLTLHNAPPTTQTMSTPSAKRRRSCAACSLRVNPLRCVVLLFAPLWVAPLWVVSCSSSTALSAEPLVYERDVRPIFRDKCFSCHGPEASKAGLRLDRPADLQRGGESGKVVVGGQIDESYLWELVDGEQMPPADQTPLSAEQRALIRRWIEQGARFATPVAKEEVRFQQVQPILLLRCAACHGAQRQEGGLDVRTEASLRRGGRSGPALIAGDGKSSLLLRRIHAGEMPPKRRLVEASTKPIEPHEIELLERWITDGAKPDVERVPAEQTVIPDAHWAFVAPRKPPIPRPENQDRVREPIDAFVFAAMEEQRLSPSPEAPSQILLRRLYFDMTGLPPNETELQRFSIAAARDADAAYEQLVNELLDSPHFGERWGRDWLDVAGYSDSEGVQHADAVRANAWRYRDYVIRSLNTNRPYDEFIVQQVAGDELADYRDHDSITAEIYDNLVATGFLRMAPDGTGANITNFVPDRLSVIDDEMEILSSAVLGLTFKCARCHSHKFDPITQRNYYGLLAIFKGAFDEHDWLKPYLATPANAGPFGRRQLPYVTTPEWQAWKASQTELDEQIAALREQQQDEATEEAVKKLESRREPQPEIRALWDRGDPNPTYLLRRGNFLAPGERVEPHVPQFLATAKPFRVVPPPGRKSTGRRLAFARWLTQPDHPLTARVFVNRVWRRYFGRGLVSTPDNFGRAGARPTHPELLDYLAVDFMENGWDTKRLHRMIVLSSTYRQASTVTRDRTSTDPDNRWLSRMPLKRLDAEALRDTLLFVAGKLDERPFGPPDPVTVRPDGLVTSQPTDRGWRRSIYIQQRRTEIPTILENFDLPRMGPNCVERPQSNVAPQALHLLNNQFVHNLANAMSKRILAESVISEPYTDQQLSALVDRGYRLSFARSPGEAERQRAVRAIQQLQRAWKEETNAAGQPLSDTESLKKAFANFCHAMMNSAEFLYID